MDGHSSHYCLDTIRLVSEQGVTLFVLPPNTTHLTQPLDKGIFGPLKVRWQEACHEYLRAHPGRVVTRFEFSELFSEAWLSTMTVRNIVASFRTTGVLYRGAITLPVASPKPVQPLRQKPIYTPAKSVHMNEMPYSCSTMSKNDDPPYRTLKHQSCLSKFLEYPSPPLRQAGISKEKSARALTTMENLHILEEKKRKKEEERVLKEKRGEERRVQKEHEKLKKKFISTSTLKGNTTYGTGHALHLC